MNRQKSLRFISGICIVFFLWGCKVMNPIPQAERVGVKLNYSYLAVPQALRYIREQKTDQMLTDNRQITFTSVSQSVDLDAMAVTETDDRINLAVMMNDLSYKIQTGTSEAEPDLSYMKGIRFVFSLSKHGREMDMYQSDAIYFDAGSAGKVNLTSIFRGFFPDLPAGVVKKGNTWVSADTVTFKDETGSSEIILNYTHTLAGFAQVDEYKCVEVNSVITGSLDQLTIYNGAILKTSGSVNGTSTWYFAFDRGILISESLKWKSEGTCDTPRGKVTIERDCSIESRLVH